MILIALSLGCIGHTGDGADDSATTDDSNPGGMDSGAAGDDTGNGGEVHGELRGTVTVQLYTYDDDGELEYLSWEDAYDDAWRFGSIWVTAYQDDGNGHETYHGSDAILGPQTGPNEYEISVDLDEATELRLYAQVDYWGDGILGSGEPMGIYPDAVLVQHGDAHGDLDISILAPYYDFDSNGGDGSAWCGADPITVSGDVLITAGYAGGVATAMLLDPAGNGPYHWDYTTPVSNGSGATGAYSFSSCANYGDMKLVGAHDRDGDTLITPMDRWGAYITSPDVDGNPITVAGEDLTEMDVQVPLGNGETPFDIVPFISISGDVTVAGGQFDDLSPGSTVHVAALKYRPSGEISVSTLEEEAYDLTTWEPGDTSGQTALPYSLSVPANTIVYLWAYADSGTNGLVNESGEYVASGGENDAGKFPTGSTNSTGQDLNLGTAGE